MLQFRIIETSAKYPDVLLHRDRDEYQTVQIKAIGIIDGQEDMFAVESIFFDSYHSACRFIEDFTQTSAEDFCKRNGISYW